MSSEQLFRTRCSIAKLADSLVIFDENCVCILFCSFNLMPCAILPNVQGRVIARTRATLKQCVYSKRMRGETISAGSGLNWCVSQHGVLIEAYSSRSSIRTSSNLNRLRQRVVNSIWRQKGRLMRRLMKIALANVMGVARVLLLCECARQRYCDELHKDRTRNSKCCKDRKEGCAIKLTFLALCYFRRFYSVS